MQEKGTISIHTENIFPIIKKFLYSDHEIFLRELVANAVDATQKLKRLATLGEMEEQINDDDLTIEVSFNEKLKTITISDRGIGMTADEIKKYINQIAFSGATEFLEKYKNADDARQMIGHFGLGFYSAFMVAKKVDIITRSYQKNADAAKWTSSGDTQFEITDAVKKERGTDIVLHINQDSEEFLDEWRLKGILEKYCRFMPVPIKFGTEEVTEKDDKGKDKKVKKDRIINDTLPLWVQTPADLSDDDYLNFYRKLYPMSEDPLFWIHLNVDYPFNLTGILYFPKVKDELELQRNKIQLYSRQVFITDEVKDVVPEFLMLLHGVIDSPDIPLNVSRSYLQSDSNVKKINAHITKKVADKLQELFRKDREAFTKKWDDIGLFVKYGMISEEKFYDKAKDFALLKNIKGEFATMSEYREKVKANQEDKDGNVIFLYSHEPDAQAAYIASAEKRSFDVLQLNGPLDSHFINTMESKLEKVSVRRIDSDSIDKLIDKGTAHDLVLSDKEKDTVKELFEKVLNNKQMNVSVEAMPADEDPVRITLPEFMRRMKDMSRAGGMPMYGEMPDTYEVKVNGNHALIGRILKEEAGEEKEKLALQAVDLAKLSQNLLKGQDLTNFIARSIELVTE